MSIDPIAPSERSRLLSLAVSTGLFSAPEAEDLLGGVIDRLFAGSLPEGHTALCCRRSPGDPPIGWTYFAPDAHAAGVWNIWWIGVDPTAHGTGAGRSLLRAAETKAASTAARVVVVETSASNALSRARRFYRREGYRECGRVPDFYGEGEAKIIFARRPRSA